MKKLFIIILLASTTNSFSQTWPVKKEVNDKKAKGVSFVQIPAFTFSANNRLGSE